MFSLNGLKSMPKAEVTSLSWTSAFNMTNVGFKKYTELLSRYNFTSDWIFKVDEFGLSTVHTPMKALAPKGTKKAGKLKSVQRVNNLTIMGCINALGNSVLTSTTIWTI